MGPILLVFVDTPARVFAHLKDVLVNESDDEQWNPSRLVNISRCSGYDDCFNPRLADLDRHGREQKEGDPSHWFTPSREHGWLGLSLTVPRHLDYFVPGSGTDENA